MDEPFTKITELEEFAPEIHGDPDEYVMGILRRSQVSFDISYPMSWLMVRTGQQVRYGYNRRFLGVMWWNERYAFQGDIHQNGPGSFTIKTTNPISIERAEWWRRLGYALVYHLPERKRKDERE